MNTYTHVITLYIDIKAKTKADSTRKFGEFDFKFVDADTLELCNYNFEQYDIIEDSEPAPFDSTLPFDSVAEAVEYCRLYNHPTARIEELVRYNLDQSEYDFARELLAHI